MARIEEKIAEIANADLRQAIAEEVAKLKKHTRFGLVFEEHQPGVVPIHGAIKRLDLAEPANRAKVLAVDSNAALNLIFDGAGETP